MIHKKHFLTCLRYFSAATLFALGCTAATGDTEVPPTEGNDPAVATTEGAMEWDGKDGKDSDRDGVKDFFDVCPWTDKDRDGHDRDWDGHDRDWDGDRDKDGHDRDDVSRRGCSCRQVKKIVEGELDIEKHSRVDLKACACPTGEDRWGKDVCYDNHGEYVSCVDRILDELVDKKIADKDCAKRIHRKAARSDVGKPHSDSRCHRDDFDKDRDHDDDHCDKDRDHCDKDHDHDRDCDKHDFDFDFDFDKDRDHDFDKDHDKPVDKPEKPYKPVKPDKGPKDNHQPKFPG